MKNKIIIIVSWIMVVVSMGIIFSFSAENSTKSSQTSEKVTEDILNTVLPDEKVTPSLVKKTNVTVREMAHFAIFAMLGFFIVNALNVTFKKHLIIMSLISIGVSLLYAILDEIHQNFVSGRVMAIEDVFVDTCGAICGILLYLAVVFIIYKLKNRKKQK